MTSTNEQDAWERARSNVELYEKKKGNVIGEKQTPKLSLYEQLRLNELQKDEELAEAMKFKHLVKRLDDDEVEFLESVTQKEIAAKEEQKKEEEYALNLFRRARDQVEKNYSTNELISVEDPKLKTKIKGKRKTPVDLEGVIIKKKKENPSKKDENIGIFVQDSVTTASSKGLGDLLGAYSEDELDSNTSPSS